VKYHASFCQAKLSSEWHEWASATRGTVDPRPGRLRQWGPLPRTPRPCANPVRASAPSRREATAALAHRPCYLRNCIPSSMECSSGCCGSGWRWQPKMHRRRCSYTAFTTHCRGGTPRRRGATRKTSSTAQPRQGRGRADRGFDADRGLASDGVGRPPAH
jgi:hypothetical protein